MLIRKHLLILTVKTFFKLICGVFRKTKCFVGQGAALSKSKHVFSVPPVIKLFIEHNCGFDLTTQHKSTFHVSSRHHHMP